MAGYHWHLVVSERRCEQLRLGMELGKKAAMSTSTKVATLGKQAIPGTSAGTTTPGLRTPVRFWQTQGPRACLAGAGRYSLPLRSQPHTLLLAVLQPPGSLGFFSGGFLDSVSGGRDLPEAAVRPSGVSTYPLVPDLHLPALVWRGESRPEEGGPAQ